jgi:predicted esterase
VLCCVLPAQGAPEGGDRTPGETPVVERALDAFWDSERSEQARTAIEMLRAAGSGFEPVWILLRQGRPYSSQVETGRRDLSRVARDRTTYHFTVLIPQGYDSRRRYPVRVYLHGGIGHATWGPGGAWWPDPEEMGHPESISVFPSSWAQARWWQASQVENLEAILDRLKRRYNIDENRVHVVGISDGGTGAYFLAFRHTTPWAAFLPFIAHPGVLGNPRLNVDGQMFVPNLANKPFYVVSGVRDPLYPAMLVAPYLDLFLRAGVDALVRLLPDSRHDLGWWASEAEAIDSFIESHPRDPLPDRVTWQTERTDRYNRAHWVVIEKLGAVSGESEFDELNSVVRPALPALGLRPDRGSRNGVRVQQVHGGSIAERAGLRRDDRIVEVNGLPTPTVEAFQDALGGVSWGGRVPIVVERRGERQPMTLRIPDQPTARPPAEAFPRAGPSGRIEVERFDNTVRVRTRGVRRFRLLLSPEEFDFSRVVRVITNGRESFSELVVPDVDTLLRWASKDNDRSMLFGAELALEVALIER